MSLMTPPRRNTTGGDLNFSWTQPCEERERFDARARALMNMSGATFLEKLDRGEFNDELEKEDNLNLSYLASLSDLGR